MIRNNNSVKSVYADNETNELYIDDTIITTGVTEFIQSAIDIVKDWPENNIDQVGKNIDHHLKITYFNDKDTKNIELKGKYPNNFYQLSKLIFKHQDPIFYETKERLLTTKNNTNKEDFYYESR